MSALRAENSLAKRGLEIKGMEMANKKAGDSWSDFIPGTSPRKVAEGIFFQPIEGLAPGRMTVTHRIYWNEGTEKQMSAFLSYPGEMGHFLDEEGKECFFWEIYPVDGDIERFAREKEMEKRVIELLGGGL